MDDKPTFRYLLDRLDDVKTQSDLDRIKEEVEGLLPLDRFEESKDFDVMTAIDDVKRDYIDRALKKAPTLYEAADLLGLKSYQVLVNWMKKLGVSK
jgi:transcriptional regulator with GAF, ATPase, and Fis domain